MSTGVRNVAHFMSAKVTGNCRTMPGENASEDARGVVVGDDDDLLELLAAPRLGDVARDDVLARALGHEPSQSPSRVSRSSQKKNATTAATTNAPQVRACHLAA